LDDDVKKVIQFCEERIGLDLDALSEEEWIKVIDTRRVANGLLDSASYFTQLFSSSSEQQELFQSVTVPETWFFRDPEAIKFLVELALERKVQSRLSISILSIPCSSGEEPYSIAMALLDAGFAPSEFTIDAIDINKNLIEKALKGVFTNNSFRGNQTLDYQQRFFELNENNYRIQEKVKENVRFSVNNILDSSFIQDKATYDVIVCRNLFIYLSHNAQKQVFDIFKQKLMTEGILFVSPVEIQLTKSFGFVPWPNLSRCAFHLEIDKAKEEKKNDILEEKKVLLISDLKIKKEELLAEAYFLAHKGEFEKAINKCLTYIDGHRMDPEGYFLMGVIAHAKGEIELAECHFQKALYLDPHHREALIYMTFLSDLKGDKEASSRFYNRANPLRDDDGQK